VQHGNQMEKKTVVKVAILLIVVVAGIILSTSNQNKSSNPLPETNWKGLVMLGLAPDAPSRQVLENDVDTGVRLTDGKNRYALIRSGTFDTGDLGKTFVVSID